MNKRRAFALHLTASASVMLVFLAIMWLAWYPAPYFEINGGWTVLQILAGVDVVLGPVLTLIVFKPGKPSLKFDMGVIIALQLAALLYGGITIYKERPEFVVFAVDRFTTIPASAVDTEKLTYPELKRLAGIGPILAEARMTEDRKRRQELLFDIVLGGQDDIEYRAELYHPYRPNLEKLATRSLDIEKLAAANDLARQHLDRFLARRGGKAADYLYLPLRGKHKDIILALSRETGTPVGWLDLDPWQTN